MIVHSPQGYERPYVT